MEREGPRRDPLEVEVVGGRLHGEVLHAHGAVPAVEEVDGSRVLHERGDGLGEHAPRVVHEEFVDVDAVQTVLLGVRRGEEHHVRERRVVEQAEGVKAVLADEQIARDDDELADVVAEQLHVQRRAEVAGVPVRAVHGARLHQVHRRFGIGVDDRHVSHGHWIHGSVNGVVQTRSACV